MSNDAENPILYVLVVGFHHKKGCQVTDCIPCVDNMFLDILLCRSSIPIHLWCLGRQMSAPQVGNTCQHSPYQMAHTILMKTPFISTYQASWTLAVRFMGFHASGRYRLRLVLYFYILVKTWNFTRPSEHESGNHLLQKCLIWKIK